jgi:hypothetical protein
MIPGLAILRDYRRACLPGDLIAGVTVAAYLVPQVMAVRLVEIIVRGPGGDHRADDPGGR